MKIGSYFRSSIFINLLSFLVFTFSINAFSQEGDEVWYNVVSVPPSPNAAALGKYGEVPVDKSTGVPNISIPLLDLNYGGIDVPISLGYHAGGIRVQDEATWVGLGWSLNTGGVITRTMRGLPDDHSYGFLQTSEKVPWATVIDKELSIPALADTTYKKINEIAKGYLDYEPDVFYYNIGNLSGSFIFNNNSVSGNYKCRFSVNKNASKSASLISDLQRNKILKNDIFEDSFSVFQPVGFTG